MAEDVSGQLSEEFIRAEVARYWDAFCSKSSERLELFFAPDATIFGTSARKAEPGRLTAVRRKREYFSPRATLLHGLGDITVQVISNEAALASYTFWFEARKVAGPLETEKDETITYGRATQLFMTVDGAIRITHEHLSAATP